MKHKNNLEVLAGYLPKIIWQTRIKTNNCADVAANFYEHMALFDQNQTKQAY